MAQADGSLIFDTKIITDGFNKGMGAIKTAAKGIGVITAGFAAATGAALKFAGELEQNLGGSEAVFKEYAETIQKTADTAFKNMGLSSSDFLATANKMGALFQGSGFAIQESAELSAKTMQRAADVASIMGIDISMAMESIAGAAKGNFTMMDNLGVAMNDTTLAAYALEKGIQKSTRQMTNQEKIGLAMQMFLEKTEYAAGNYAKENETLAGSLGTAKAAMENFLAGSGKAEDLAESFSNAGKVIIKNIGELTPALASGLSDVFTELAPMMPDMIEELVDGLLGGADMLADSFGDMFASVVTIAADSAPEIIKASAVLINSFIDGLVDNSGELTAAALEIGEALVSGIISIAPRVVDAAGKILGAFATEIGNAMPLLTPFTAAVKFLADNVELCAAAFVIWKTSAAITGIITTVTSGIKLLTSGVAGATVAQKLWNIAMSANPIGAVVTGVTALTAGVIALASAFNNAPEWEKECEEIRNHREELEKSNAEWETFIESQKKAEATTNSEMNHIQKLADELRTLADENGNVAESEQSRAKFILNELNEALGTEYSLNQGQITQYQQLSSEIDNLIAKRRAEALLKSKQEGYDKAVGELGAKQDTLNEEIRKYDLAVEAVERYKNQIEHTKQKMEELENTKPPDWEYEYDVLKSELDDLEDGLIGANKELKEQEGAMNTASVAVDQLSSTIEDYESTYQKILEGDYEAVFKSSYKSATGYADGTSAAIADGTADVDATAVESGINVAEAMANGIKLTVPNTAEAIAGLGPQLHDKVHSMIQGVRIEGESLILSLAGGVEKTIPDAVTISENGSQAIIDGLKIHDAVAQRLGVDYIQGVILGLESMRIPLQNTAASIMSGMHQFGAKPAVHSNSPSKDGIKLGSDYVVGVEIGLENEAPNLNDTAAETAKGMNDSFINACNSKIGSIREAIGGITGTIAEENQNKLKRYQKEVDKIKILHDFGIDDEKTYYAKLEYLRDHYLTKYSDAWIDATQEIYDYQSDCVKEAIDDELEELDRKLERGKISEEEYYKEIARIRDTYTEGSDEWYKLDDEIFEYNKRLFEEEKETVKNTYEEISDFINKKLDAIADKQKALSDKLVDNTHLFENVKINAGEDSYEFYRLNDFSDEIKNAKKYRELLTQAVDRIKSSGVSDSAISGILEHIDELGNDEEGLGYLEALLSANDKDFGEYMSSYAELLETEAGTAAMRYSDDMEKAAVEGYNYMKSEFEKIGLEVPESFYASGTLSAEKFGEAFVAELNLQMEEIRGRLLEFNVQLGTALGSGQTVVTHDNRTTTYHINAYDATDAVTQIKNHETIKRLSGA